MNKEFQVFNSFIGYGNPKGDFWTFGIEEGISVEKDFEKHLQDYSLRIRPCEPGEFDNSSSPIYDIACKIISGLDNWHKYRVGNYLQQDSNEFHTNLLPLGKKKITDREDFYNTRFGFKDFGEYIEFVRETRWIELRKFWEEHNPKWTICFGKSYWWAFEEVLDLKDSKHQRFKLNGTDFIHFPAKGVLFTPFFNYRFGMSDRTIIGVRRFLDIH